MAKNFSPIRAKFFICNSAIASNFIASMVAAQKFKFSTNFSTQLQNSNISKNLPCGLKKKICHFFILLLLFIYYLFINLLFIV